MHERKTAKMKLGFGRVVLLAAAILTVCAGSALAQESLHDIAKEYGFDWLFGRWTATTDEGANIHLAYKPELNGHLVTVSFKMEEYALRGMIFLMPYEEMATQLSVDNRGRVTKGTWELMEDKLIWKTEYVDAWANKQNIAIIYSNIDVQTMKVEVYGVAQDGSLADEPGAAIEFKREAGSRKAPTGKCQKK